MKIGPTKYSKGSKIDGVGRYSDGTIALRSYSLIDGQPEITISVNLSDQALRPGEAELWIKTWSENEGVAKALVEAGIVELTGEFHVVNPFGSVALHARLTEKARAFLNI